LPVLVIDRHSRLLAYAAILSVHLLSYISNMNKSNIADVIILVVVYWSVVVLTALNIGM
jgi:hypothetical protein